MQAGDIEALKTAAGPTGWSVDPAVLTPKLHEWRGRFAGETPLLLLPADVEAVSRLMSVCHERSIPVTVQGGNTGLVGGQIPQGEALLSTERLNRVREIDLADDVLIAEGGATLAAVRGAADAQARTFPLSLASEGSCTVGGLVSTNAGGTAVLRYGSMRALVLGVEAVLADGRIHHGLKRLRKDASGLDLKDLFVGAEGTLGVVTAASLKLFPKLEDRATAFAGVDSPEAAVALLSLAKRVSGGAVEAFEIIGRLGVELAVRNLAGLRDPLSRPFPYLVLIEIAYAEGQASETKLLEVLEKGQEAGLLGDAALARSGRERAAFWSLREGQSEAQKLEGSPWKHDVATPISRIGEFVKRAAAAVLALEPEARILAFGHIGDGNIHFDVLKPLGASDERHDALRGRAAEAVHAVAVDLGGTISAEHGLGVMKVAAALAVKPAEDVEAFRAVRKVLDPRRILNPRLLF